MGDVLDERGTPEEKAARNQSLFRAVNEQIRGLQENASFSAGSGPLVPVSEWVCECANPACMERIALSPDEYGEVRSAGNRFAVAPDDVHIFPDVEDVTERYAGYWVVEKRGKAKEIAEHLYEHDGV